MKNLSLFLAVLLFISGFGQVLAQEVDLGDISVAFCNDPDAPQGTKSLQLKTKTGVPTDICMFLSNKGNQPLKMSINFVDGTVTADSDQKKACQPEGVKTQFGQYVTLEQDTFEIPAQQTIKVNATATFPDGMAGMNYGCVTSQIISDAPAQAEGNMFTIQTRRANFVDVLVDGTVELGVELVPQAANEIYTNLSDNPSVAIYQDLGTKEYVANVTYKNVGNISQEIKVVGTVAGYFTQTALPEQTRKVLPKQEATFTFILDKTQLPWYKGNIQLALQATHTPLFDFDLPSVTEDMKTPKQIITQASFMLMPWILIGSVGGLLLLLIIISLVGKSKYAHGTKKTATKKAPAKKAVAKKTPVKKAPAKTTTTKTTPRRKSAA